MSDALPAIYKLSAKIERLEVDLVEMRKERDAFKAERDAVMRQLAEMRGLADSYGELAQWMERTHVEVTEDWLFCPGCGRPRVDGPNEGPYCLPSNCEMWVVVDSEGDEA